MALVVVSGSKPGGGVRREEVYQLRRWWCLRELEIPVRDVSRGIAYCSHRDCGAEPRIKSREK
jgi:hypothetical protein